MVPDPTPLQISQAMGDFQRARRQAALQEIMAQMTGQSNKLLPFDQIRQQFRLAGGSDRGLREIPLDAIVGSVGRYNDFTRTFLPRSQTNEQRWVRVETATLDMGLPPIEVYQVGEVYFVLDGNHRVSVARQLGTETIEAYVTEFQTKVPLQPDDQPDDIFLKAEYANFLEKTKLDTLRPEADFRLTVPGRYWELETQIEALSYLMNQDQQWEISYQDVVCHWYDHIYLPVVQLIREKGILRDFPGRTETDLYLWIFRHQAELEKSLGWAVDMETAAADLVAGRTDELKPVMARVEEKVWNTLTPDSLDAGPEPGQWRQSQSTDRLFSNILVSITGQESGWAALDQAVVVARQEGGRLFGLHLVAEDADRHSESLQSLRDEFERRCRAAEVTGQLSVATGPVARQITDRARWAQLVVIRLNYPPGTGLLDRLSSGFRTVLQRSPRPVLVVPQAAAPLQRALLAYDGSPKAREGLFVAAYLAACWQISLVVLTVVETGSEPTQLTEAQHYLASRGGSAEFLLKEGAVAETILQTASEQLCDFVIMGGYGRQPVLEVVLGSEIDQVLRQSPYPLLICR